MQKNENRSIFATLHKAQVQVDEGPKHKAETLNQIEKKLGKSLALMGTGTNFLNRTPVSHSLRSRIDKWDHIKLKSFYMAQDILNRKNCQPTNQIKILLTLHSIEDYYPKYIKNSRNQTPKYQIIEKRSNLKIRFRSEQRICNRRISSGCETLKELLNILSHQGSAN